MAAGEGGGGARLGAAGCGAGCIGVIGESCGLRACEGGGAKPLGKVILGSGTEVAAAEGVLGVEGAGFARPLTRLGDEAATALESSPRLVAATPLRGLGVAERPALGRAANGYLESFSSVEGGLSQGAPNIGVVVNSEPGRQRAVALLQQRAQLAAESAVSRLKAIPSNDVARLQNELAAVQSTLPSGTKISFAGEGAYVQIRVTDGAFSYAAKVDLVSAGVGVGGVKLTAEVLEAVSSESNKD